jgi:nucleotide-binding universal stress UspA family protein
MKILVTIDGSKHALKAFRHAIDLASKLKEPAQFTLLSVHDDVALRHASRFVGQQAVDEYLAEISAQDMKGALTAARKAGIDVDRQTAVGHVAWTIADIARKGRFDLLVMGTKGRSAFGDWVVGSVAQRVAELSTVPVLLVRSSPRQAPPHRPRSVKD